MLRAPSHPRAATVILVAVALLGVGAAAGAGEAEHAAGRQDAAAPSAQPARAPAEEIVPGELLVTLEPMSTSTRSLTRTRLLGVPGVQAVQALSGRISLARTSPGLAATVAQRLASLPDVRAVEPNIRRTFHTVPDDTSYSLQWAHPTSRAEDAWAVTTGGGTIGESRPLIAIVDSGIDATHPDLADQVVSQVQVQSGRIVAGIAENDTCGIGHGTLVSGVAAARGDNDYGVSGLLWNGRIIDVALTDAATVDSGGSQIDCRGPTDADTIAAIDYLAALPEPPLVMNLSFGSPGVQCSQAYQTAIDGAIAAGIAVVSSAGNSPSSNPSIPASCNGAISVTALTRTDQRAGYAQHNDFVDLTAPGGEATECPSSLAQLASQNVLSTSFRQPQRYNFTFACQPELADPNGHRLEAQQGTSFSTPYVAAAIALIRGYAIDLGRPITPQQAEAVLEATAVDLGASGRDEDFGWGRIDVAAAVEVVRGGQLPDLRPDPDFPVSADGITPTRISGPVLEQTDPISQAIAVSQSRLLDDATPYVVLARMDDYADALAGSAVGLGVGPLLFTPPTGPLDEATHAEIRRVLPSDGSQGTVFIMGGPSAVPTTVDAVLSGDGYLVRRIQGGGREETAVQASLVLQELRAQAPTFIFRDWAFLASGRNFADAVAAGQMAAYYGVPILLTNPDALHPATQAELRRLAPERVIIVGGPAAVSESVQAEVQALGFVACTPADDRTGCSERIGGATRVDTALGLFNRYTEELATDGQGSLQEAATIAVNLRAGFTDALSATLIAGLGNWFLPLDGVSGSVIAPSVRQAFCGFRGQLFVIGGTDHVGDATVQEINDILSGQRC